ncbi:CRISPR-associated helicase Cas3' [Aneurinibacillus uraniidurans]|uniref:CRISPR-associated helicase Cas3' n=1 Tax=Aneurinibacillus uraniidurans TaxID=2966586 RepID=UPI00234B76DD|nr:CRISPR-associated helicase Cas3' [Aneurinibacillus sp. B1]WCN36620.1 CRISPR-associated helicase Cas3' [Aneurinibacillus sp. B1]
MISIAEYIRESDHIWAHVGKQENETLEQHSDLTQFFFDKLLQENGVEEALQSIVSALTFDGEKLDEASHQLIITMFKQAVYMHDIGKVNPVFQKVKMRNRTIQHTDQEELNDSHHALLSALLYVDIFSLAVEVVKEDGVRGFLRHVLYTFAYVISRHHTYLEDLSEADFQNKLERLQKRVRGFPGYVKYYEESERVRNELNLIIFSEQTYRYEDGHEAYSFYILARLLYSALVAADFYATYTYENEDQAPEWKYVKEADKEKLYTAYRNTKIYQGIEAYKKDKNVFADSAINKLRSDIFLEAEERLLQNLDKQIYYLEAPTGSGKTNMSINLALQLLNHHEKLNKIVYVFPFNTLIEQTNQTLQRAFEDEEVRNSYRISVVNSVTPIVTEKEEKDAESTINYREELLNRQMLQYPVTITSHVNFFHYLFGTGRESNLAFAHLCNSVIIIDEVQSYRNDRWVEIIRFLQCFSEWMNMKIIIMSATLPKLDQLLQEPTKQVELVKDPEIYFQHPLFKGRVHLHFSLLNKTEYTLDELLLDIEKVREERGPSRILIEFIKKKTAREFYRLASERYEGRIIEITGDDSSYFRRKILDELGAVDENKMLKVKDVLVITTQVIEAGVDIDMDVGFKDISLLDSEEQFLGRINRSCLRSDCRAYFFNLDGASQIYRNDWRLEYDLLHPDFKEYLVNKRFKDFYEMCFTRLLEQKKEKNKQNAAIFTEKVQRLDFKRVAKHMELIEDRSFTLFVSHVIRFEDGTELAGEMVWQQYKELLTADSMEYAERQVRLSAVREKMSFFTYSYIDSSHRYDKRPKRYDEQIGDLFFIEQGAVYMYEDKVTGIKKFDHELYEKEAGGLFS